MTIHRSIDDRSDRKKNYRFKPGSISYSLPESFIGSGFYFIFSFLFSIILFIPVENSLTLILSFIREHTPFSNLYMTYQNHYSYSCQSIQTYPHIYSTYGSSGKERPSPLISFRICLKHPALLRMPCRSVDDLHISFNTFTS